MDRPSILICDDSIDEIRVIVSVLKTADYKLIIAQDGRQACDRASLLRPDLILLDVRMPGIDGFAACRLLKAHRDTRHIPIIFLTAANDLDDRLEGLRVGAVDYIVKPAHEEEVLLRVAAQLARNRPGASDADTTSSTNTATPRAPEPGTQPSHQAIVLAFIRLLEEAREEDLHLDLIASKLGTSRTAITEAFRATLGTPVVGWLREQRLKRACHWLARSTLPISQIAQDLAYNNSGNFATAFRDRYGIAPREFRKLAQADPLRFQHHWHTAEHELSLKANPWLLLERSVPNPQT